MPKVDIPLTYVTEQDSKLFATRQILPFLYAPERPRRRNSRQRRRAPTKALLSLARIPREAFTNAPELFKWKTRPVYDVDGLLLFRFQTIALGPQKELQVVTAASSLLRSPVWSIRAGRAANLDKLINKALAFVKASTNLVAEIKDDEKTARLICYSYPKLGILCHSKTDTTRKSVVDLWDLIVIPVESREREPRLELVTRVWSPYDFVSGATVDFLRMRWLINLALLPPLPKRVEDLPKAIELAGGSIAASSTTTPELCLVGQQTPSYCAPASIKMILDFYEIEKTQQQIAYAMNTRGSGTLLEYQESAIPRLTQSDLTATLDDTTSFAEAQEEICQNRPFKTGTVGHARACGGFLIEGSSKEWLYIYDPLPPHEGRIYHEAYEVGYHLNYLYVRANTNELAANTQLLGG